MNAVSRRSMLVGLVGCALAAMTGRFHLVAEAQPLPGTSGADSFNAPLIELPASETDWELFRRALDAWRRSTRAALDHDGEKYRNPTTRWASYAFACGFFMLWDQRLFDYKTGRFSFREFLRASQNDFGGFDAVVLWNGYPRLGADDRNQFDFYRDMPGGLEVLRSIVRMCRSEGVKVLIPYNPWDTGTRREAVSELRTLRDMVAFVEADGIFLDTMAYAPPELMDMLKAHGPSPVLEGEDTLPLQHIHDHHLSWAQNYTDKMVPGILRNKWFERRHMQHVIDRWDPDRSMSIHTAWMNGSGIVVWENVFGSWMGWSERDKSMVRLMLPVQRRYASLLTGEGWTPLVPTRRRGVYASLWVQDSLRLWTLINRSDEPVIGDLLSVNGRADVSYFDVFRGVKVEPLSDGKHDVLSGALQPKGVGAFVSDRVSCLGDDFFGFLDIQRRTYARYDSSVTRSNFRVLPSGPQSFTVPTLVVPPDMVAVPATTYLMRTEFQTRECGFYDNSAGRKSIVSQLFTPVVFEKHVSLKAYAIDVTPVTNANFDAFLRSTAYQPSYGENFLKHWGEGRMPDELADHPVVYVDLEDARAYARWVGKRLPTEEEWQYAAQGPEGLKYPWGLVMEQGRCNGGELGGTTSVTAYPTGRSPFGCYDMCGNTWEWTESERSDGRTRFCILRGGSFYTARGSHWYMDGGPRPNDFAAKYILMWPGVDRSATIGFRCIRDLS